MSEFPKKDAANVKYKMPVHFIKSTCFRVVHANGVWYGGDSQGNLHLTFFNERAPLPKTVVINLDESGSVIGEDESKRESKQGIVREMEVDVVLSMAVAIDLYKTLGENIKAVQATMRMPNEEKEKILREDGKHESGVSK